MYQVIVHNRAARYLKRLPKNVKEKIKGLLTQLATSPQKMPNVKGMVGEWAGYYRLRYGDYRIIFAIDHKQKIIYVDHVGSRGDVY